MQQEKEVHPVKIRLITDLQPAARWTITLQTPEKLKRCFQKNPVLEISPHFLSRQDVMGNPQHRHGQRHIFRKVRNK